MHKWSLRRTFCARQTCVQDGLSYLVRLPFLHDTVESYLASEPIAGCLLLSTGARNRFIRHTHLCSKVLTAAFAKDSGLAV